MLGFNVPPPRLSVKIIPQRGPGFNAKSAEPPAAEREPLRGLRGARRYMGFKFWLSRSAIQASRFSRPAWVFASKYARV